MKLLKLLLVIFGVFIYMGSNAQLTTQKKYAVGSSAGELIVVDLKANGTLLITSGFGGRVMRLNSNYDTVWVKVMIEFFVSDAIMNSENDIILVGQRIYPTATNFGNIGIGILKIDMSGNFINSKYRQLGTGALELRLYPSIVEYKANNYIVSINDYQDQYVSHLLKLDNDFNVTENKKATFNGVLFSSLSTANRLVKKSNSEIIIYPIATYQFYAFYSGNSNSFLVIDTSLNNTFNKRLNDNMRKINAVAVLGDDIFIGGNMYSNKLINNQFDTNWYYNSFLTKVICFYKPKRYLHLLL